MKSFLENVERIAPSIMCCDLLDVRSNLIALKKVGVKWLHVDVMDGRFAPNFTFGSEFVQQLRKEWPYSIDLHIMSTDQNDHLDLFLGHRPDLITLHLECVETFRASSSRVRAAGLKVGVAVGPRTSIDKIGPWLAEVDAVLIMGVVPGSVGKSMDVECLERIREVRRMGSVGGSLGMTITADGGVTVANAGDLVAAGADRLVSGSSLFHTSNMLRSLQEMAVTIGLARERSL